MIKPAKSPSPVALEDLLRLKRAERPDAAFWNEFERGLRQKQMAAIMEPKPWWLPWSLALRRPGVRLAVGASACAVLVAGLALRLPPAGHAELASASADPMSAVPQVAGSEARENIALASLGARDAEPSRSGDLDTGSPGDSVMVVAQANEAAGQDGAVAIVSADSVRVTDQATGVSELSGRTVDVLSAALAQVAMLTNGEFGAPAFSLRSDSSSLLAVAPTVESAPADAFAVGFASALVGDASTELVFADPTGSLATDPRHQRLLAGVEDDALPGARSGHSLTAVRDHVLHHVMNNDELYASISRLGVRGDRLLLRF